jgi:ABC-type transport system substrate-binding protein
MRSHTDWPAATPAGAFPKTLKENQVHSYAKLYMNTKFGKISPSGKNTLNHITEKEENMKNRTHTPLIVLIVLGLLLAACQPAAGGEETAAPVMEEQPAETTAPPVSEPAIPPEPVTGEMATYVYETLFDAKGAPVLAFGEPTVSEDGLEYSITLRPGVVFQNGKPFNADAVIANFNRWFDPEDALRGSGSFDAWAAAFGGFKGEVGEDGKPKSIYDGIEKVDDLNVLIHLNTPDDAFLSKLSDIAFAIISPDALAAGSMDGGTGAYVVGETTDSGVMLEPNDNYWNPSNIPDSGMEVPSE